MAERPATFAPNLAALQSELWDSAVFKLVNGKQVFDGIRGERAVWSGLYLGSSTATTAAVWEALLRVDPSNPKHALLRDALLSRASPTNGFGSTHGNRRALAALGLYLDKATFSQPKTTISIAGLGEVTLDETRKAARRSTDQEQPLNLTVTGGPIATRLQIKYLPLTPGDKAEAKKEGLIVSRSMTWLHSDGSEPTHHDDAAGITFKVPQGEVLEIHTQLINDEPRNHVALVVPIAAGFEPLNPNLETASSDAKPSQADSLNATYVQRLDQEVRYYFTELPRGTFTFHFRVRASSQGSFVHPSPWAELMYREEVRGRGAGMRVVVTGSHEQ
jgi:hypothetical protein